MNHTCEHCGNQFTTAVKTKRFCGEKCKRRASKKRAREKAAKTRKRCANCGEIKASNKGIYCSKPECQKRSVSDSAKRNWSAKTPEEKAAVYKADYQKEQMRAGKYGPRQGPVRKCQICNMAARDLFSMTCGTEQCRREKRWQDNHHHYRKNPSATRERDHKRRARLRGNTAESVKRRVVFERDGWKCALCGKRVLKDKTSPHPLSPSIDHIIPISKGGAHSYANVQLAHLSCNVAKGNRGGGEQLALI